MVDWLRGHLTYSFMCCLLFCFTRCDYGLFSCTIFHCARHGEGIVIEMLFVRWDSRN